MLGASSSPPPTRKPLHETGGRCRPARYPFMSLRVPRSIGVGKGDRITHLRAWANATVMATAGLWEASMPIDTIITALVVHSLDLVFAQMADQGGQPWQGLSLVRKSRPPESVLYLGNASVGVQFALHAGAPGLFNGHTLPASRVAGGFRWSILAAAGSCSQGRHRGLCEGVH